MNATKGYLFTVEMINDSCPEYLKPYILAHKLEIKERDAEMHRCGIYTMRAVSVAVEHNFAGQKAKSKYFEKPLMVLQEEESKPLSEEELQKRREAFLLSLQAMQTNFELNHPKQDG